MGGGAEQPNLIGFLYFMIPTFFCIQDENNLIRNSKIESWLYKFQIEQIIQSCNDTLKYYEKMKYNDADLYDLNKKLIESAYKKLSNDNLHKKKKTNVYIMIDYNTKFYKIGKSINPLQREKTLQSEKPTIKLIHSFKAYDYDERMLHDKFKDKRIRGEWFNLDQDDIDYIKNNYK
jgi:hypothetical protein